MKILKYIGIGLIGTVALSSCSDSFLDDKKNYDNVTTDIYNYEAGVAGRLNDIYSWCLPDVNNGGGWASPSVGTNDTFSGSTEEYSGLTELTNPAVERTADGTNQISDWIEGQKSNIQASVYGRIRNINDFIAGVENGNCSEEVKAKALGQAHFFRAWVYYLLFRIYGGVPVVTDIQDPVEGTQNPRRSAKYVKDFIISELDESAKLLAPYTMNGGWSANNFGRVTTGTALALKGRVLVLWASPLFNRANDVSRWKNAYTTMKAEKDSIDACGYHLFKTANNVNGSDFALQFLQSGSNPEAVFVTLYNNKATSEGGGLGDQDKNSSWERWVRPKNTTGSGLNASAMLVDLFPMSDGKIPAGTGTYTKLQTSDETYDKNAPFLNRDPRFYRTFAFPGFRWAYNGTGASSVNSDYPDDGANYVLWNYCWYTSADAKNDIENNDCYYSDGLLNSGKSGVYIRKRSDDYDVNSSPLYSYVATYSNGGFAHSGQQYMEIRYAEVILNLAEAACGAGELSDAVSYLQQIRARAGYTADNNYGLPTNLTSDQAACMSAILYERQIEFAYEGKRYEDMHRWLLFDGGANFDKIAGAPADWKLTGWGGNTCTWLGVKPLNGQRRENMQFRVNDNFSDGLGGVTAASDPLAAETRPAGVDFRKSISGQLNTLATWYRSHLVRKTVKGDGYDSNHQPYYIHYFPTYYLLGFPKSVTDDSPKLEQTIGWTDATTGTAGSFDPLAD